MASAASQAGAGMPTRLWASVLLLTALLITLAASGVDRGPTPVFAQGAADPSLPRRVLVLFPGHNLDPIAALLERGLRDALRADGAEAEPLAVYTEFLDTGRMSDAAMQQAQLEWLHREVRGPAAGRGRRLRHVDRPEAGHVLAEPLFPDAVAVFAALDPLVFPDLALPPDADALWVRYNIGETLGLALNLQPNGTAGAAGRQHRTDFNQAMLTLARRQVAPYAARVAIEEVADLSMDALVQRLSALPPEYGGGLPRDEPRWGRDAIAGGRGAATGGRRRGRAGVYQHRNERGRWGGRRRGHECYATLGDAAAQLVLRRLRDWDTNPDSRMSVTPMFVIDWRQLQRWGLREDRLPPKSQVRYKEPSIWEQYRWHMVSALLLILAQSLLVTGLLVEHRHRMRTQTTLAERQEELITVNTTLSGRTDEVKTRNAQVRTLGRQAHHGPGA